MNCNRSELLTYHLMLKALVQYQDSSLQYLDLLKDLAKVLNIPQSEAFEAYKKIMLTKKPIARVDAVFDDPDVNAFDDIFDPNYKYQGVVINSSKNDMKGWDKIDCGKIIQRTKVKRGIQDFVQLVEQQKTEIQRKRLLQIQSALRAQLQGYVDYLKQYTQ